MDRSGLEILSRVAVVSGSGTNSNDDGAVASDQPLDFSMKSNTNSSSCPPADRASVINKPVKKRFREETPASAVAQQNQHQSTDVIDDHFKRSLGLAKYQEVFTPSKAADKKEDKAASPGESQSSPVSIIVDDNNSSSSSSQNPSVDDHFAKALGSSKWAELSSSSNSSSSK